MPAITMAFLFMSALAIVCVLVVAVDAGRAKYIRWREIRAMRIRNVRRWETQLRKPYEPQAKVRKL